MIRKEAGRKKSFHRVLGDHGEILVSCECTRAYIYYLSGLIYYLEDFVISMRIFFFKFKLSLWVNVWWYLNESFSASCWDRLVDNTQQVCPRPTFAFPSQPLEKKKKKRNKKAIEASVCSHCSMQPPARFAWRCVNEWRQQKLFSPTGLPVVNLANGVTRGRQGERNR